MTAAGFWQVVWSFNGDGVHKRKVLSARRENDHEIEPSLVGDFGARFSLCGKCRTTPDHHDECGYCCWK